VRWSRLYSRVCRPDIVIILIDLMRCKYSPHAFPGSASCIEYWNARRSTCFPSGSSSTKHAPVMTRCSHSHSSQTLTRWKIARPPDVSLHYAWSRGMITWMSVLPSRSSDISTLRTGKYNIRFVCHFKPNIPARHYTDCILLSIGLSIWLLLTKS